MKTFSDFITESYVNILISDGRVGKPEFNDEFANIKLYNHLVGAFNRKEGLGKKVRIAIHRREYDKVEDIVKHFVCIRLGYYDKRKAYLLDKLNRELLIIVVKDVMPKFKQLTSAQKRKVESRIKFLTAVTKELQRISGAISNLARNQK